MNIYKALAGINNEIKAITKSRKNTGQNFMFRGIDDVMNELHALFAKNEVIIVPETKEFTTENRPTKSGSLQTFTRLRIQYTFVASDGSSVTATGIGEAMDTADKGMNKAMSIALKYVLLQMFLIPTEEMKDPDYNSPEETNYQQYKQQIDEHRIQDLLFALELIDDMDGLNAAYKQNVDVFNASPVVQEAFTKAKKRIKGM